jgi:hypothetical protein
MPDIFCQTLTKFGYSQKIFMESPVTNVTEIHPRGDMLIHADRRMDGGTGMAKLIGAFYDHAN